MRPSHGDQEGIRYTTLAPGISSVGYRHLPIMLTVTNPALSRRAYRARCHQHWPTWAWLGSWGWIGQMRGVSRDDVRPLLIGRAVSGLVAVAGAPTLCRVTRITDEAVVARRIGLAVAAADAASVSFAALASGSALRTAATANATSDAAGAMAMFILSRSRAGRAKMTLLLLGAGLASGSLAWVRVIGRL